MRFINVYNPIKINNQQQYSSSQYMWASLEEGRGEVQVRWEYVYEYASREDYVEDFSDQSETSTVHVMS
jgi:hypothetical protein